MGQQTPDEMDVLRALAHPVRWGILQRLAAEPGICACDFTEFFDVSQPTISVHLKVLRAAGLVTSKRIGTTICYSIAPGQLTSLGARLAQMAATADQGQLASLRVSGPQTSEDLSHACGRRRAIGPCLKAGGVDNSGPLRAGPARVAMPS
jgi:ArsR family transcriptional regulator